MGFLLRLVPSVPGFPQLTAPEGLAAGMMKCRAWKDGDISGTVRVPATRVFSLHVVQAGSARTAGGGRACPDSVQPSW